MFEVGQLVTGNERNTYGCTNQKSLCLIIRKNDRENIEVLIVAHATRSLSSNTYSVYFDYFKECTLEDFLRKYPDANVNEELLNEKLNEIKNMEEKKKMELRMNKEKIGNYTLSVLEKDALRNQIITLLEEYDYDPTEKGVNAILDEWIANKGWIINLFKQHPNYNGKYQITFDSDYQRNCNTQALCDFGYWLEEKSRNVLKEIVIGKFSYIEVYRIYNKLELVLRYAGCICDHGYNAIISGKTVKELKEERNKWYEKYKVYSNSDDIYIDDDVAYSMESYGMKCGLYRISRIIRNYQHSIADEDFAEKINKCFPKVKAVAGQKVSRIINKICKLTGIDKEPDFNREFAKYSDAINPLAIKRHTVISCHPVDYLTMSFGNSWASCHTIDKHNKRGMPNNYSGCYSSGTESYMLDGSSFVFYTVDKSYDGNEYELQDKISRNMFHIGEDKLVQARVYPQTTDGESGIYKQIREITQKVVADCLGVPNMWTNVKGTSECEEVIISKGTHYIDYENFSDCNVSYLKDENSEKNTDYITVGHDPICPCCGKEHDYKEAIECEACYEEYTCEHCGASHDRSEMHEINGSWYCANCCFYCEYHGEWERYPDDSIYVRNYGRVCDNALNYGDDFFFCVNCNEYFYDDGNAIHTEDDKYFCNEDCAESAGYRHVEDYGWYPKDELYYCDECGKWVLPKDWNDDHVCCNDCALEKDEEDEREVI